METIYSGDTFTPSVAWFIPNVDNPFVTSDAVISKAEVVLIRNRDRKVIIEALAEVDGNDTRYMIPSELLKSTGSYTAYMTAEFNDGNVLTQRVQFQVLPKV